MQRLTFHSSFVLFAIPVRMQCTIMGGGGRQSGNLLIHYRYIYYYYELVHNTKTHNYVVGAKCQILSSYC